MLRLAQRKPLAATQAATKGFRRQTRLLALSNTGLRACVVTAARSFHTERPPLQQQQAKPAATPPPIEQQYVGQAPPNTPYPSGKVLTRDGNFSSAYVAYGLSNVACIYPITPSSDMGEHSEAWAKAGVQNCFGQTLKVVEMQSEGGAAGAMHGAAVSGSLAVSYTASQGLLLMYPNMFKIAGELLPVVLHVSARALAGQALSIFGDHSDICATRAAGWAMLASCSPQECHDLALVSHLSALQGSLPFIHFFDGFRTSHELNTVKVLSYNDMASLIDREALAAYRLRCMNPEHPQMRGTSQGPDIYFQMCEAANRYYTALPEIVEDNMAKQAALTGNTYKLFEYHGDPEAEDVIVIMGSGYHVTQEAIDFLRKDGHKVGAICVRLFRPFSKKHLIQALPKSCKRLCVLDRSREPGAPGDVLLEDVRSSLYSYAGSPGLIIGGRYGLGSKEFTPGMVVSVFENMALETPKDHFTVGIVDDVTRLSLPVAKEPDTIPKGTFQALLYGIGADGTVGASKNAMKLLSTACNMHTQGHFVYDAKKSGGVTCSHLRFGKNPINSHYGILHADLVACHFSGYVEKLSMLDHIKEGGIFLLQSPWNTLEELEEHLPSSMKRQLARKKIRLINVDARKAARESGLGGRINYIMQTAFFKVLDLMPMEEAQKHMFAAVEKDFGKFGGDIVANNKKGIMAAMNIVNEIKYPVEKWMELMPEAPPEKKSGHEHIIQQTARMQGDLLPVSVFMESGVMPTGTSKLEKRTIAPTVPIWNSDKCTQCNQCSLICPHAAIRPFLLKEEEMKHAPSTFKTVAARGLPEAEKGKWQYRLQVDPYDCTGCNQCVTSCDDKALTMAPTVQVVREEGANWNYAAENLKYHGEVMASDTIRGSQLRRPYLEFSGACTGCSQTPLVKLVTQLFGDRMVIANATGCSSIWGGSAPTSPYTKDEEGAGPTWANSLFEDNAEYGLGMALSAAQRRQSLHSRVKAWIEGKVLPDEVITALNEWLPVWMDGSKSKAASRKVKAAIKSSLEKHTPEHSSPIMQLKQDSDMLTKPSIWIVGGDGWAYDIGFGGVDHVAASGVDVNILVLDTEVYSNTGGQSSKSTQAGAIARYSAGGKDTQKKDLGLMLIQYENVFVGSIALGADSQQALATLTAAESYPGVSVVLAYGPCIAHGIKGGFDSAKQQKLAVQSGYFPLYRYDPRHNPPFSFDSPEPTLPLVDFLMRESRYSKLLTAEPERSKSLVASLDRHLKKKFRQYQKLAAKGAQPRQVKAEGEEEPRYSRGKSCVMPAPTASQIETRDEWLNQVIEREAMTPRVHHFRVMCPVIAKNCKAGQFVIVRVNEQAERIPLTIADFNPVEGWVSLVVQNVGFSSAQICKLKPGEKFLDIAGPLGHASEITKEKEGAVVCIGGGVGIAPVYPIQRALKLAGNKIHSIIGARTGDFLFWADRMAEYADSAVVMTDDGSVGNKGFVTNALEDLIKKGEKISKVIAIGPAVMMKSVCAVTKKHNIPTVVSLNSIMVDGTGMCGGCRVEVGGKTMFVCVDGPEFDGNQVDWKQMESRLHTYDKFESEESKKKGEDSEAPVRKAWGRTPMPNQDARFRVHNFHEVAIGYTPEQAIAEANRCKQCPDQPCQKGCPVGVNIKKFIGLVSQGKFLDAAQAIKVTNPCPAIAGRVCPQEVQCEAVCTLHEDGEEPVAIGRLERFVADFEAGHAEKEIPALAEPTNKKVAIVGAGPAGLVAAAGLAQRGHEVTVFEALHGPGGVLIYGIPEFRLPKAIVARETMHIKEMGVKFRFNFPVGQAGSLPSIMKEQGFDAAFIGTGAGLPWFLDIPGENLKGVFSSNEFLTRVNLMKAYRSGESHTPVMAGHRVVVVGGGNVAMDSARCAIRLGCDQVTIVYRRTQAEMPARAEELEHALEEGIQVTELANPVEVLGDDRGFVSAVKVEKMKLGEPGPDGRRKPVPTGEFYDIETDTFVVAIGNGPNPMLTKNWPELKLNKRGNIVVDENLMTSIPGIYAGGDIVLGAATVIQAMGAGKLVAEKMDSFLTAEK
eukprot:gb/GEZN01000125.1/.p1 GENE.gb/GEZN01000125.1/~~gb/GEZN01000125.1/.p1  ORF type:complete len:2037 (+),score=381.77 gb/GEZN01000125.1/:97-6207(+)